MLKSLSRQLGVLCSAVHQVVSINNLQKLEVYQLDTSLKWKPSFYSDKPTSLAAMHDGNACAIHCGTHIYILDLRSGFVLDSLMLDPLEGFY